MSLTQMQQAAVNVHGRSFVVGPAGTGKTHTLQQRLLSLLANGEPAYTVLVLVADATQREQFATFIQQADIGAYGELKLTQYNNIAREMVELFWPLVATSAGFASSYTPPTFLGYDLSQLLMWRTVMPMLEGGSFANLRRRPQQIISQLLDTLNRAALNNLDIATASKRQIETWEGEPEHIQNLEQAEDAAHAFRQHCLDNNLLDLSLTVDTFNRHVLSHPEFSRYFSERFRHILIDNIEEQTPAGQQFIAQLIDDAQSATLVFDTDGGYRRFMAADPTGSQRFRNLCDRVFAFERSFTSKPTLARTAKAIEAHLRGDFSAPPDQTESFADAREAIVDVVQTRYRREMVYQTVERIAALVHVEKVPPSEIAIVVPYLDGALRYSLTQALKRQGVPMNLVRRRASPREEPRVRAWITWLALAHPDWGIVPSTYDVSEALSLSIAGLDPVRAAILAQHAFPASHLLPASEMPKTVQDRIDNELLVLYESLRIWLQENGGEHELDHFLYHLFADLLSRRDYQPTPDLAAAGVCDWLVRLAGHLVDSAEPLNLLTPADIGNAFIESINQGLVTSSPPDMGDPPDPDGVVISTIYGYLLRGNPTQYQVWLEASATGWWDIPRQPLSNAFVLAESYDPEQQWTVADDYEVRNELLKQVIAGLTNRCGEGIILTHSDLDRRGQRQEGPLWQALLLSGIVEPVIQGV